MMIQSTSVNTLMRPGALIDCDFLPGQPVKCFKILCQGTFHHFAGESGRGCLFVPLDAFKVVAHELLVE